MKIEADGATRGGAASPREREATRPTTEAKPNLDRYVVLEQIGAGGMGVVHRAYDPKLRREVALKMLRFDRREGSDGPRAESRILREARAMAQLSHPNVLPVYDVESVGEIVYIAMEYVDGLNLSRWLRRKKPPWREVVDVFIQAGRGLHAAHQSGIVHRDFKPANVLLGNRGRVLVTDFGLARAGNDDDIAIGWSSGDGSGDDLVTEIGEVVGTPAYMAPEQLRGDPVDARADQYAFCIALFEGLFRRRPFSHRDHSRLLDAKERGEIVPDTTIQVPTWLFRIVERGLQPDPRERFASMDDLITALGQNPALKRKRWLGIGGGALLAASAVGAQLIARVDEAPCPTRKELREQLWDDDRSDKVRDALLATARTYANETAERVQGQLSTYADSWAAGHVDACEATRVRDEQSGEAFDLRMGCLRRHRAEFEATVETLSSAVSERTLMRAASLVAGLPSVDQCADLDTLRARNQRLKSEHTEEVEREQERLSRAKALVRAGRSDDADELLDPIVQQAEALGAPLLHGEAMVLRGLMAEEGERDTGPVHWYELAFADAVEGRDDELAIHSANQLTNWLGVQQGKTAEAEVWAMQSRAWLRGRADDDVLRAQLLMAEGGTYQVAGQPDKARTAYAAAVDILEREADTTGLEEAHRNVGLAFMALGQPGEAEVHFARVLQLRRDLLGPNHPLVGRAHQNLGATLYVGGQLARALPHLEQSLTVFEEVYGAEHPKLVGVLGNLGSLRADLGEHEEAQQMFTRALSIVENSEGDRATALVGVLGNLAGSLLVSGNPQAAVPHLERAAALVAEAHGPTHPEHVVLLSRLGEALHAAGRLERAHEVFGRAGTLRKELPAEAVLVSADAALALGRFSLATDNAAAGRSLLAEAITLYQQLGPELDPRRGGALLDLAKARLADGDAVAARPTLEEAIGLLAKRAEDRNRLAEARFALARAITQVDPSDRDKARALAQDALAGMDDDQPLRQTVVDWLAAGR